MLKLDWGDAKVWMDLAEQLYLRNVERHDRMGFPAGNELNVAVVCAGYAFELIFKIFVKASGGHPIATHKPSAAYADLKQKDSDEVDRILASHGWNDPSEFLTYLDEKICHGDRKYWMRPAKGGPAQGEFSFGGRKGMDVLKKLHEELSELAIKRINDRGVDEIWPGTPHI